MIIFSIFANPVVICHLVRRCGFLIDNDEFRADGFRADGLPARFDAGSWIVIRGTFDFLPQPMGLTGENFFVERRFRLRGAGGTVLSWAVTMLGVFCEAIDVDGGASENSSLDSRATSDGICRLCFRFRRRYPTSRIMPNSEAMEQLPLLPNAVFAW